MKENKNMEEIYTCEYCKLFTTTNSGTWGKHEQNCWANPESLGKYNTDWYCKICETRFITKKEFTNHNYNNHMTSKQQKCSYCCKEWLTTDLHRIRHEAKCKKNSNRIVQIKCSYCNRNFNSQELTNEHELICYKNPVHYGKEYDFTPVKENNPSNIGVYKIVSPSGKVYIGMTSAQSFKKRWNDHHRDLKKGKHRCIGLQNAFNKYGWEILDKIIVDEYIKSDDNSEIVNLGNYILLREQEVWDECKSDGITIYNSRPTASGSVIHNDEWRKNQSQKIREYHKTICRIYYINCALCGKLFCAAGNQAKYCKKCNPYLNGMYKSKNKSKNNIINTNNKISNNKKSYVKCLGTNCCNYILNDNNIDVKYCSPQCEYKKCNGRLCCNYISKSLRLDYCSDDCKSKTTILTYDILYDLHYNQLLSTRDIAKKLGYSNVTVQSYLKQYKINPMSVEEMFLRRDERDRPSYDELYNKYIKEGGKRRDLERFYQVGANRLSRWLNYYHISK